VHTVKSNDSAPSEADGPTSSRSWNPKLPASGLYSSKLTESTSRPLIFGPTICSLQITF